MFETDRSYTKNDIYEILNVPPERRKGVWDTGYRAYEGDIYIFSNVGIPGRTGHDYNNYWDGDLFVWEAKTKSNINQPLIKQMLSPAPEQNIYLFTRTYDKAPFTYEGKVRVKKAEDTSPVKITWELSGDPRNYYAEEPVSFREGSVRKVTVNKYERNPLARRMCIAHYGIFCQICTFDFERTYGTWGKGFIHVHHIIPLSEINKEYILDPVKDLIPVCPNCHSMLHRKKKTLPVKSLKALLDKRV